MKLTDYIGIYGAIVSTVVFVWNMRSARRTIQVEVMTGLDRDEDGALHASVVIKLLNFGVNDVEITHVGMLWPYRKIFLRERILLMLRHFGAWRRWTWCHGNLPVTQSLDLPTTIAGGRSFQVNAPYEAIEAALGKEEDTCFVAYAQDALGRNVYSDVFEFHKQSKSNAAS